VMPTNPSQVLIIGASRGIGMELVRQYRQQGAQVTATARTEAGVDSLRAMGATALSLDVTSAESASRLAWQLDGCAFDVVVFAAGVYGPRTQGLQPPPQTEFDHVMHSNVLGAMQVLPQLDGLLAPGARLAVLSSLMGSIGARNNPGGWLYRASKAALNSVLKDVSLVFKNQAICVSLHPGWVRTDMGGAGADLSVEQSASDLRAVIAALKPGDNGQFFNHDGHPIPW
jgi:NAD(P)-dependent dehydrogenase (short-subunit alcohol dehydrogenase family)